MMNGIWFLRMARWARRPPSWRMVVLVGCLVAAAAVLFVVERYIGWPDWATVNGPARLRIR